MYLRDSLLLLRLISLTVVLLTVSACGGGNETSPAPTATWTPTAPPTEEPQPVVPTATATAFPFAGDGKWEVSFQTSDGVLLSGTLYGQGESGVILAPAYPGGQEGWKAFAETVAAQGYRALTFDFRGHGSSEGVADTAHATIDLMAAVTFMREQAMVDQIVLMGAGWGGTAAIRAAGQDASLAGLAVLSAPRSVGELEVSDTDLASLTLPTLWLAARNDLGQDIEAMADQTASPDKTIWVYEGSSLHGTFIFEGANGSDLTRRLLEFINRLFGA